MPQEFEGKVALVTGAGSGIGLATARAFAKAGASVALADRDKESALSAADQLVAAGYLELREFAARQGWALVREYTDEATAKNGERSGFKLMWADVAKHRFDLLLFWSLDRLTREGTYKTLTYLRRLSDAGVKFKSYTEQYIDSLGVFGEAIIGVLAAVAAQERIRISERTKAGLARTRAQGTRLGRPAKVVDIRKARKLRVAGMSLREIAQRLRVSPALVYQKLKNV
jgi:DNA invertase Pin-like site-specific DNA recombinase